ncbi:hypothetical protein RhiirC2_797598 [Rhizophagus irregularis]|uniref:Uncharacterized protein n=1 Tax=Rhizophagus irregularis TaxID=588596 RepID=A0A2N1M7S9_9GLOM|nr:hypothetical protein RhiirC2_797598 [Rhizophagus irregularis]
MQITQIEEQEEQEKQWISNTEKTSFVWKFFQAKTNDHALQELLQQKLHNEVTDWIVTDRLPFNTSYVEETCIYAFITNDLWTSRAKTRYIGITCHWLTQLCDILVCVEKILYSHIRTYICETIKEKLKVLGLEKKVNVAVTDNGSNMLKQLMNKMVYVKLNQFFESPKQIERLEDARREIIRQEEQIANETGLLPFVENNENIDENNQHEKNKH